MSTDTRRGTLVGALRRELQQLVEALEKRYRRNHATPPADDPYRDVRTARDLGGAGNFGGGGLDRHEDENAPGRRDRS